MTAAVLAVTRRRSGPRRSWGDRLRLALGFAIVSAGGAYLAAQAIQWVAGSEAAAALGAIAQIAAMIALDAAVA
jgi:hypothetical protein